MNRHTFVIPRQGIVRPGYPAPAGRSWYRRDNAGIVRWVPIGESGPGVRHRLEEV